jgi:two-component system chemotaxis response regulator CheY
MKVLLVDDSTTMRRIQKTQLNNLGITHIAEADNGEQALLQLVDNPDVDVVMLDWNMPVMDGLTFLRKMRENKNWSEKKVIMCTSESEKNKVIEALKAGANNYIVKPFTPEALKEKLGI